MNLWRMAAPAGALVLACLGVMGATAAPTFTVLYNCQTTGADGQRPTGTLVADAHGVLYGTTSKGGSNVCTKNGAGCGSVYSLTPPTTPGGAWTETVLWSFSKGSGDGYSPNAGVMVGPNGVLYGTTPLGGAHQKYGVVYSLTPPASPGGAWTESILWSFNGTREGDPMGPLVMDSQGILYGTVFFGGTIGIGAVYSLTPPAVSGDAWSLKLLYNFGNSGPYRANSALVMGADGVLYGTSGEFGTDTPSVMEGVGVAYSLTPPAAPGDKWTYAKLGRDGSGVLSLSFGAGGALYGASSNKGRHGGGYVYQLTPPAPGGGGWKSETIYNFPCCTGKDRNGYQPTSSMLMTSSGSLIGATGSTLPHSANSGTIYELTPPGVSGGAWKRKILHNFLKSGRGEGPQGLLLDGGVIYGTTYGGGTAGVGTVYALTP